MAYTVKQLAKLSGVTVRTLHFYDEIHLLKPAYCGDNNYRYYGEEQLLMLQQILFYRELGFSLNAIQKIMGSDDFNKLEALRSHKHILEQQLDRTHRLIKTIDKTIVHLGGTVKMRDIEMYEGFDPKKQQEYENYLINNGTLTQNQIDESWQNIQSWKQSDWENHKQEGDELNKAFVAAIGNDLKPVSTEAQALVRKHYAWVKQFWTPTRESYIGLGQMYLDHSDFREFYEAYHPKMTVYLVEAMKAFVERELF